MKLGNESILADLLSTQGGVDANCVDCHGRTALHYAACEGRARIVQMLLNNGADFDAVDEDGRTALHFARHPRISFIFGADHGEHCNGDTASDAEDELEARTAREEESERVRCSPGMYALRDFPRCVVLLEAPLVARE